MKKVLALVLAVIMVCTMAFAIGVGGTGTTTAPTNFEGKFVPVAPGQSIYLFYGAGTDLCYWPHC